MKLNVSQQKRSHKDIESQVRRSLEQLLARRELDRSEHAGISARLATLMFWD